MPCIESLGGDKLENLLMTSGETRRLPLYCQWEITCRCNLKCVMCYTDCFNTPEHIKNELPGTEIIRIMDELKAEGVLELTLTGGEPMAHPDFETIYKHAINCGFLVTVFTNGTYINEKWINLFNEFTPTMIEISFHGFHAKTFDEITAMKGSYEKVKNAVTMITENELPLTIKTTSMTLNRDEVLEIKKWVRSMKNTYYRMGPTIRPLADGNETSLKYQLADEELDKIIEADEELIQGDKKMKAESPKCHSGFKRFHIDAYGNLQLCSQNRQKGYNLLTGNFKEAFYEALPGFPCENKSSNYDQGKKRKNGD